MKQSMRWYRSACQNSRAWQVQEGQIDEIIIGDDGHVWLMADLWGRGDNQCVTGLVQHGDRGDNQYDWSLDNLDVRDTDLEVMEA